MKTMQAREVSGGVPGSRLTWGQHNPEAAGVEPDLRQAFVAIR